MDGREGMSSFYLSRGVAESGSNSGSGHHGGGLHLPPGFKTPSNPNNMRVAQAPSMGSSFQLEHNPSPFRHGFNISGAGAGAGAVGSGGGGGGEGGGDSVVKKKRGRPRKYGPDGSNMSLALSPAAASPSTVTPAPKKNRGRPRGSGRKQRLANVGEWMNNSAGLAFTPHIIHVSIGEDVADKVLSFAQQRPRALCVLSGNGSVSAVTLRQFTSSGGTVTYEGRFEIVCLSGSYLLDESGDPHNRSGGLSISVCSADGHVIGGAIGGRLIASSLVQVVVCSFVYGGNNSKSKVKADTTSGDEKSSGTGVPLIENFTQNSSAIAWPQDSRANSHMDIDLTRG